MYAAAAEPGSGAGVGVGVGVVEVEAERVGGECECERVGGQNGKRIVGVEVVVVVGGVGGGWMGIVGGCGG